MATEVLRARASLGNHLPSDVLPSPSPAKPGRRSSAGGVQAPHCRRPLPSPAKHLRGNCKNSRRTGSTPPARSEPRSGSPGSRHPMGARSPAKKLVMEEVTIMKRGEVVKGPPAAEGHQQPCREEAAVGGGDLALWPTERLGPDPEILPKQMRLVDREPSLDSGWDFVASPSPSSLPFPASFFAKKDGGNKVDLATKGLRYLLRLDLP